MDSVVLCCQNLDNFKKEQICDILSNIGFIYVLSSNNANSLTSEVVCKMAGNYYEKEKSTTEGNLHIRFLPGEAGAETG